MSNLKKDFLFLALWLLFTFIGLGFCGFFEPAQSGRAVIGIWIIGILSAMLTLFVLKVFTDKFVRLIFVLSSLIFLACWGILAITGMGFLPIMLILICFKGLHRGRSAHSFKMTSTQRSYSNL